MFSDVNRVRQILRELFFEHQTFDLPTYLTSAYLDQRRAVRSPIGLVETQLLLQPTRLANALKTSLVRTPLEAELLSCVFSNFPVVLIQSGSGSGKSSALRHLKGYTGELDRAFQEAGQTLPAGSLALLIDFQDAPDHLKKDVEGEKQDEQAEAFIGVFCERLDTLVEGFSSEVRHAAFRDTFMSTAGTSVATGAAHVRSKVLAAAKTIHQGKAVPADLPERALSSAQLTSAHDRAVARLLLLQAVARQQSAVTDLGLALLIDNVDPFPEYLQTALMKTIQTIVYGMHASSTSQRSDLTIAVFARISTSARQSGALDGLDAERFSFRAADPADIVFYRLAAFLQKPASLRSWNRLGDHDRHEVLARCVALLERLLDSRDQFFRVFSALAGTNIRTACKFARKWVLTPRLDEAGYKSIELRPEAVGSLLGFAMLFRVSLAVERALRLPDEGKDIKTSITGNFFSYLLGILWTTGLVTLKGRKVLGGGPRRAVSLTTRKEIETLLREGQRNSVLAAATSPLARAANDLARKYDIPFKDRVKLSSDIAASLRAKEAETVKLLNCLVEGDVPLARGLCGALIDAVAFGIAGGFSERSVAGILEDAIGITTRGERAVPSRWESVSILISGSHSWWGRRRNLNETLSAAHMAESEVLSLSAVNVFCSEKTTLLPIALHILCILKESKDGVDAFSLQKQLLRWGFEEDAIYQVMTEMVDIDRRLIFSAVKDSARGISRWFDGFHKVHISSAGLGYLEAVVPTPAYLQWAFLEIGQVRDHLGGQEVVANELTTGLRRLTLARKCLELGADDEERRLGNLMKKSYTPFSSSLSPFSSVYFRSLRWFIEDASGLSKSNYSDALDIAQSFMNLGRKIIESRSKILGMMDPEWESNLLFAEHVVRSRFKLPESNDLASIITSQLQDSQRRK